jgi:hypothetical protein
MTRWQATVAAAVLAGSLLAACNKSTYDVDIELWHCGIPPLTVDDQTWEVPHSPPFVGASTLPRSFTGHGTATINDDKLVYVDDGGTRIVFRPAKDVPPPAGTTCSRQRSGRRCSPTPCHSSCRS